MELARSHFRTYICQSGGRLFADQPAKRQFNGTFTNTVTAIVATENTSAATGKVQSLDVSHKTRASPHGAIRRNTSGVTSVDTRWMSDCRSITVRADSNIAP